MDQVNKCAIPKEDTFAQDLQLMKNAAIIHLKDAGAIFSTAGVLTTHRNNLKLNFN